MSKKPSKGNAFDLTPKKSIFSNDRKFNGWNSKLRTTETCGTGDIPVVQTVLKKVNK